MDALCREEVVALHRFFEGWLSGSLEATEVVYSRLSDALHPDFSIIFPDARKVNASELVKSLRSAHGGRGPSFRIAVRAFSGRALTDALYLATYEEWQGGGPAGEKAVLSTALFERDADAPGGVRWLHVHETRLAGAASAPAELD